MTRSLALSFSLDSLKASVFVLNVSVFTKIYSLYFISVHPSAKMQLLKRQSVTFKLMSVK